MKEYPYFENLKDEDRKKLISLNEEDLVILPCEKDIREIWYDDSELCFSIRINGVGVSFLWVDPKYYTACEYYKECSIMAKLVIELIDYAYDAFLDNVEDKKRTR